MSADLRRSSVLDALTTLLSAYELALAMSIYDQEFAHQQFFLAAKYLERLSLSVGLGDRQRRVFASLNTALTHTAFVREPRAASLREPAGSTGQTTVQLLPALLVFGALCERVSQRLLGLYPATRSGWPAALRAHIEEMRVDEAVSEQLRHWADDPFERRLQVNLNEQILSELVHVLYLWSCNEIGPVKTDQIFAHIIRELQQMPEAAQFSPRRLM